jgi:hypothetical protein
MMELLAPVEGCLRRCMKIQAFQVALALESFSANNDHVRQSAERSRTVFAKVCVWEEKKFFQYNQDPNMYLQACRSKIKAMVAELRSRHQAQQLQRQAQHPHHPLGPVQRRAHVAPAVAYAAAQSQATPDFGTSGIDQQHHHWNEVGTSSSSQASAARNSIPAAAATSSEHKKVIKLKVIMPRITFEFESEPKLRVVQISPSDDEYDSDSSDEENEVESTDDDDDEEEEGQECERQSPEYSQLVASNDLYGELLDDALSSVRPATTAGIAASAGSLQRVNSLCSQTFSLPDQSFPSAQIDHEIGALFAEDNFDEDITHAGEINLGTPTSEVTSIGSLTNPVSGAAATASTSTAFSWRAFDDFRESNDAASLDLNLGASLFTFAGPSADERSNRKRNASDLDDMLFAEEEESLQPTKRGRLS